MPAFHFAAGLSTGLLSAGILQPFDLIKTRIQQSHSATLRGVLHGIAAGPNAVRQLWRGTFPSIIRTGFGSALYFTMLNAMRRNVQRLTAPRPQSAAAYPGADSSSTLPKLSNTANLATGATARIAAGLVLMPMTVIKVRYESNLYAYPSIWRAMQAVVQREGVRGLFAGFGATAARDAPYAGLYVLFYERSKSGFGALMADGGADRSRTLGAGQAAAINFASGAGAAGLATAITNPFDAVKTRVQLFPQEYPNLAAACQRMLRREGVETFFSGMGLRMARKALSSALVWTLYEDLIRRAEGHLVKF